MKRPAMLAAALVALILAAPAPATPAVAAALAPREIESFRLYKFQQPIGEERAVVVRHADGSSEIRTSFAFNDRTTTVPLSATLELGKNGSPVRYQAWGKTSRFTVVDDRVSVSGGSVTIDREGKVSSAKAPAAFFFGGKKDYL
jgi:hypothetical protein